MIIALIQYLLNLFIQTEKSDLDLLSEEERIKILRDNIDMQNAYEHVILWLIVLVCVWVISKIMLNFEKRKKIRKEVEQIGKTPPSFVPLPENTEQSGIAKIKELN